MMVKILTPFTPHTLPHTPQVLVLAGTSILSMLLVLWDFENIVLFQNIYFENILCLWHSESDVFQTVTSKSWWPGWGWAFSSVPFSLSPSKTGRSVTVCCGCLLVRVFSVMGLFPLQYLESIYSLKTIPDWNSPLNPPMLQIRVTKSQWLIGKHNQRHKEMNTKGQLK